MQETKKNELILELYHSVRFSVQNNRPFEHERLYDLVDRIENLHNKQLDLFNDVQ